MAQQAAVTIERIASAIREIETEMQSCEILAAQSDRKGDDLGSRIWLAQRYGLQEAVRIIRDSVNKPQV